MANLFPVRFVKGFLQSPRTVLGIGEPYGFMNNGIPNEKIHVCHELNAGLLDAEKKKPAVLVIGFGNSSVANRLKYSEAYTRIGIPAIHYNSAGYTETLPTAERANAFAKLFGGEEPGELEPFVDRPFLIHCLSQNGAFALCELYRYLELNNKEHIWKQNCKGILLDSTPGRLTAIAHAFARILTRPYYGQTTFQAPMGRTFVKECMQFFPCLLLQMKLLYIEYTSPERLPEYRLFDYIKHKIDFPETVYWFYTKTDNLIEPKHTEELIDYNVARGKKVTLWAEEAAPHVFHVTRWKQKYVDFCQSFGRAVYAKHFDNEELLDPEVMKSGPPQLKKKQEVNAEEEAQKISVNS